MANIQNVRMGVCTISVNGVDVGNTLGGAKVTISRKLTDIKVDKYGDSPIDKVVTDVQMKMTMKIAEPVVAQIKAALPESDYQIAGSGSRLGVGAGEGTSLRSGAGLITLHPIANSTAAEDVVMYLGVATASPVINYEVANQRVFDLEFDALVSEAYVPGRRLGHIGFTNIS